MIIIIIIIIIFLNINIFNQFKDYKEDKEEWLDENLIPYKDDDELEEINEDED